MLRALSRGPLSPRAPCGLVRYASTSSSSSSSSSSRAPYALSPSLRSFPASALTPDPTAPSISTPNTNANNNKNDKAAYIDPRRDHGSGFLFTPAAQPGSRVYHDESELSSDVRSLIASMVPLNTLRSLGDKLQPRARVKWTKYVAELERTADLMAARLTEMLALPASARVRPALEVVRPETAQSWQPLLERFLRDSRERASLGTAEAAADTPMGSDWVLELDVSDERLHPLVLEGGPDYGGAQGLRDKRLFPLVHWTRAKVIVVPFVTRFEVATQAELASLTRKKRIASVRSESEIEAHAALAVLEERLTLAKRLGNELRDPNAPKITGKALEQLNKLQSTLPKPDPKATLINAPKEESPRVSLGSSELASLDSSAEGALDALLWTPAMKRAEEDGRAHLLPRIKALRDSMGPTMAESSAMLVALESDPELKAFMKLRGIGAAHEAALSAETSALGGDMEAVRALTSAQQGLAELQRAFPLPTHIPESELFDRRSFEEQRTREHSNAVRDALIESQLREHALTRPVRAKGEDKIERYARELKWREERTRLVSQLSVHVEKAEGVHEDEDGKKAAHKESEDRALEGFFSSQTDELFDKVAKKGGNANALKGPNGSEASLESALKSEKHVETLTLEAEEEDDSDETVKSLLPKSATPFDQVSEADLYEDEDWGDRGRSRGGGASLKAEDAVNVDEDADIAPGSTPSEYRVQRMAVVHLSERKVWLSEIWQPSGEDAQGDEDDDMGQLSAGPLVREQVLDIPGDWLTLFKTVPWPARTLRHLSQELEGHLHLSQGQPAVLAALEGQAPLE